MTPTMLGVFKISFLTLTFLAAPYAARLQNNNGTSSSPEECTLDMFGNSTFAYIACLTENALQRNWYPSPIAGLFSYQVWNGFDGFWQNGLILETMANFMDYANNTRYKSILLSSDREIYSLVEAYYPQPSYDDMAWYGLSYLRIYEVLGANNFLVRAKQIYDWNWKNGWDKSGKCHGGFWFDQTVSYKGSITNVQMLQLGAKLYLHSGNDTNILQQIKKIWDFLILNSLLDSSTFLVSDGLAGTMNCTVDGNYGPTYTHGVLIGGLVYLSKILDDPLLIQTAHFVAQSVIKNKTKEGVLMEYCDLEPPYCNDDAKMFKGIFVRNLRYLMDVSDPEQRNFYQQWLELNAKSLLTHASCQNLPHCNITYSDGVPFYNATVPVFDTNWYGPFNYSAPMQQGSALDLFVSLIPPGTTCKGPACSYDPATPPPRPMTCKDNPCPSGQQCCEYQGGYRTCCTSDQKCVDGYCE